MVRVYSFLSFGQVEIVVREERRDDESVVREEMMKEEKLVALSPHQRPPRSPSGGPRLIIAAQSGIEYILKPLLSTLCPCRRYISRCTTGALPVFVWNFYRICKWAAVSTSLRRAGRGPICVRGVVTNLIFIRWSLQCTVEWYRSQALADKTWIHSIIRAEWRSPLRDRRMTISIVSLWWCKAAQAIRAPIYPVVRRIMSALILMNILDLIVEKNMCCFVFAEIICL